MSQYFIIIGEGVLSGGGGGGGGGYKSFGERCRRMGGGTKIDALRILFLGSKGLLNMDFNLR